MEHRREARPSCAGCPIGRCLHDPSESGVECDNTKHLEPPPERLKLVRSERRRLQNLQAQKKYRQKQKQRVQILESLVKSQTTRDHDPSSSSISASFVAGDNAMVGSSTADLLSVELPQLVPNSLMDLNSSGGIVLSQAMDVGGSVTDYDSSVQRPGHDLSPPKRNGESEWRHLLNTSETHYGSSHQLVADSCGDIVWRTQSVVDDIEKDGSLLVQCPHQELVTLSKSLVQEIRDKGVELSDVIRAGLWSLEQGSLNAGEAELFNPGLIERREWQLPDPRANTIRLTRMSFVAAMISNAAVLGLTAAELVTDDTNSPFYTAGIALDATAGVAQGGFANITQHLRPTRNQVSYHHHPFIDALPFPTFRERIIALLQADPPILDQKELCRDLQNDGITCWGSSLGAGPGNSGAPWDIRSWEARPWFMKKWWMLTGGTGAEMYQQTLWWYEMRGDRSASPW